VRLVAQIRRAIGAGTFVYADFFPGSRRAKAEASPVLTFEQACTAYTKAIANTKGDATRSQYENALTNLWRPMLGDATPFETITHAQLAEKIGERRWPSAKSYNNAMIPLRGVFALQYAGPRAVHDPMAGIGNLAVVRKKPDPLTPVERDRILEDMERHYDARVVAYFRFAFATGMRPEELIALRWEDIDQVAGVARVRRVRTFKGSERDGTKTNTERDVDLVAPALAALATMKPWTLMKGGDVFENPITGRPWHDERSQRDTFWKPSLRRAGVRYRTSYKTRHTYATVNLMGGIKPAYIALQMGHSLKMLLEVYARWIPGADGGEERERLRALHAPAPPQVTAPAADGVPRAANDG